MTEYKFPTFWLDCNQYTGNINSIAELKENTISCGLTFDELLDRLKTDSDSDVISFRGDGISLRNFLLTKLEDIRDELSKIYDKQKEDILYTNPKHRNNEDLFKNWEIMLEETKPIRLEIRKCSFDIKQVIETEWDDIPEYGDIMTMEDFKEHVSCGGFIDYDGYGDYATKDKSSNKNISPSDIKLGYVLDDPKFTHVIWYNR